MMKFKAKVVRETNEDFTIREMSENSEGFRFAIVSEVGETVAFLSHFTGDIFRISRCYSDEIKWPTFFMIQDGALIETV